MAILYARYWYVHEIPHREIDTDILEAPVPGAATATQPGTLGVAG